MMSFYKELINSLVWRWYLDFLPQRYFLPQGKSWRALKHSRTAASLQSTDPLRHSRGPPPSRLWNSGPQPHKQLRRSHPLGLCFSHIRVHLPWRCNHEPDVPHPWCCWRRHAFNWHRCSWHILSALLALRCPWPLPRLLSLFSSRKATALNFCLLGLKKGLILIREQSCYHSCNDYKVLLIG